MNYYFEQRKFTRFWFGFSGRISRWPFLLGFLGLLVAFGFFTVVMIPIMHSISPILMLLTYPFLAILIWSAFTLKIKRWHDMDRSGFHVLLSLIPVIGAIFFFIILIIPGTFGKNRYG
ncbi:DUF805 domain-containing protein [Chromobacterium vaccinii]|uniref:DUF805 domain-containing protein n=1 Tax=Chromobacterium vaccinii TaxID=1108595 RepID=UPI001E5F24AD|nr:DUF805 domain-containing protein [Chromobacterium vaccinii]MCD4500842.1 DUF805 domain-containing protein [Chromobacterium vaccinii]